MGADRIGEYRRRVVDRELDEFLPHLPAISLDGLKGVGKTTTGAQRASTVLHLDDPDERAILEADPTRITRVPGAVLLDEWPEWPRAWDVVRHAVDDGATAGRYLLAGSATPVARMHSGAGRIIPLRMRPMTLPERGVSDPTVGLSGLMAGPDEVGGESALLLDDYLELICRSGMPGIASTGSWRLAQVQLDGYLERLFDHEMGSLEGIRIRRPALVQQWARAYAAATATTASYEKLRDAATPGESAKPTRVTAGEYRGMLSRLWFLDPLEAWLPSATPLKRLGQAPKHHLADPAFAARLLRLTPDQLRREAHRNAALIGQLWESLVALTLRVFAQPDSSTVNHLRTQGGEHEVDFIIEAADGRIVACEAKLAGTPSDADVKHLHWLRGILADRLVAMVVVTAGKHAYTRPDGVHVVPLALLGP